MEHLSPSLRAIVSESVALLGEVVRLEFGEADYRLIEGMRSRMAKLRGSSCERASQILRRELRRLRNLDHDERMRIAKAFALMLELMNACEGAYRSSRIMERSRLPTRDRPDTVIYVLTAHPTEARSPENIGLFHQILTELVPVFERAIPKLSKLERERLRHILFVALRLKIVRLKKPRVADEADHIYSTLLRDETLRTLLVASRELAPFYARSWVGGDKDGHPGVDEKVFLDSLSRSRRLIVEFSRRRLREVQVTLATVGDRALKQSLSRVERSLSALREVKAQDAKRLLEFRTQLDRLGREYSTRYGPIAHPALSEMKSLLHVFPAMVVPLEFRESSDVLMSEKPGRLFTESLAIERMLMMLRRVSEGVNPLWYVRGFIVSHTLGIEHLLRAAELVRRQLGVLRIPVIPLFEERVALLKAPRIVEEMLETFHDEIEAYWGGRLEVMLGYSDSAKESGVLRSRLQIAETMYALDRLCRSRGVTPIFFQGSGGSVDRGGGSIPEQTEWWPAGALKNYKVTVQGEMVERSLASPEITRGQIERIVQSAGRWKEVRGRKFKTSKALERFADDVASIYVSTVHDQGFMRLIEEATPYPYLNVLSFGSRPAKRPAKASEGISLTSLRAIPWILCWTQTRVLFPTWWGVGSAWEKTLAKDRAAIKQDMKGNPLFATFVRTLGYTLAKVELAVWRLYIEESTLEPDEKRAAFAQFESEFQKTHSFVRAMLGTRELIPGRPWLAESIRLRATMIHPLNCLQIIAMQNGEIDLLRLTVAGVALGMMTTG